MGPTCQVAGRLLKTDRGQFGLVNPNAFQYAAFDQLLDRTVEVDDH